MNRDPGAEPEYECDGGCRDRGERCEECHQCECYTGAVAEPAHDMVAAISGNQKRRCHDCWNSLLHPDADSSPAEILGLATAHMLQLAVMP